MKGHADRGGTVLGSSAEWEVEGLERRGGGGATGYARFSAILQPSWKTMVASSDSGTLGIPTTRRAGGVWHLGSLGVGAMVAEAGRSCGGPWLVAGPGCWVFPQVQEMHLAFCFCW